MAPCLAVGCIAAAQQTPVSQMETLTRGVVAVHTAEGNFVSWRLLGTDPEGTRFTLLRDGEPIADGLAVTNYADSRGTDGSRYAVVADNEAGRADAAGAHPCGPRASSEYSSTAPPPPTAWDTCRTRLPWATSTPTASMSWW